MIKKRTIFSSLSSLLLTLPLAAFSFSSDQLKNVDVSAAIGPSWYRASNGYMQVTSTQTDTLSVSNVTKATTYRLGVGYHFFTEQLNQRRFLNDLLVQLNAYHSSGTIKGSDMEYNSDCCVNYSFRAPFHTTRLMIDVKPSLFTSHHLSPYAIAGAGVAWNRMSLNEAPYDPSYASGIVTLPNRTSANLAYDLGVGLRGDLTKHLSTSIEYISTHMGRISPNKNASSYQTIADAPHFPVRNQNLLFGVNWKF